MFLHKRVGDGVESKSWDKTCNYGDNTVATIVGCKCFMQLLYPEFPLPDTIPSRFAATVRGNVTCIYPLLR
eukprot:scaffold17318_cov169-Amphora_coffeaeformis.AAC.2